MDSDYLEYQNEHLEEKIEELKNEILQRDSVITDLKLNIRMLEDDLEELENNQSRPESKLEKLGDIKVDASQLQGIGPFYINRNRTKVPHHWCSHIRNVEAVDITKVGEQIFARCCITPETLLCISRRDKAGFRRLQENFDKECKAKRDKRSR